VIPIRSFRQKQHSIEELGNILKELHYYVDVIIVEGMRDESSLMSFGCTTKIEILGQRGINDFDLTDKIANNNRRILILTDFDEEGLRMNRQFSSLFEIKGVKVEIGLRRKIGHLMSKIGVYTIEALDNIKNKINEQII
jgi:5S rRNA maturation endonuclease (ribonuclease M5)